MTPKPVLKTHKKTKVFIPRNDWVPGYVYIFRQSGEGLVKIGLSRSPLVRKYYLQQDYGDLQTVAIVWVLNMKFIESQMHRIYVMQRVRREYWKSGFTEWFSADLTTALEMRICLYLLGFCLNSAVVIVTVFVLAFISFLILR